MRQVTNKIHQIYFKTDLKTHLVKAENLKRIPKNKHSVQMINVFGEVQYMNSKIQSSVLLLSLASHS